MNKKSYVTYILNVARRFRKKQYIDIRKTETSDYTCRFLSACVKKTARVDSYIVYVFIGQNKIFLFSPQFHKKLLGYGATAKSTNDNFKRNNKKKSLFRLGK